MKAIEDLERMFVMLPWLEQHPGIGLEEAARHFGLHPRRLLHELEQLNMMDAGVDAIAMGHYGYLIEVDIDQAREGSITIHTSELVERPLTLDAGQAFSLMVALHSIEPVVDPRMRAAVRSAIDKLVDLVGETPTIQTSADEDDMTRELLARAITEKQRIQLSYDGVSRGVTTNPCVDPVALVVRGGACYLQAWSLEARDWRLYKTERIAEATWLDEASADHGAPPAVPDRFFDDAQLQSVQVDLGPTARWVPEYHPSDIISDTPEALRITLKVASQTWLVGLLLRLGGAASRVEPIEVGEHVAAAARAALEAYASLTGLPAQDRYAGRPEEDA